MANLLKEVSAGSKIPEIVNAVIEVPKGSKNKYEYDPKNNCFILDRVLHSTVYYPGDYGFIPQTLAEDKDPLDILILVHEPNFTGAVIPARPIGLIRMKDNNKVDDKIVAVPVGDPNFNDITKKEDLPKSLLQEIVQFFETYSVLEKNKTIKVIGIEGKEQALETIRKAARKFK